LLLAKVKEPLRTDAAQRFGVYAARNEINA